MTDAFLAPPYARTGRKLGLSVLVYVLGVIAVVTLEPFVFHVPSQFQLTYVSNWFDVTANVVMFVPAGFLYSLSWASRDADPMAPDARRRLLWRTTALGVLASTAIETTQLFIPGRYSSPIDVATNGLGAALGAWIYLRAARRLGADTPIVGRLALELPLMGLVYVTAPLCTLAALTVRGGPPAGHWLAEPRALALVALALFGGTLLGHVQRRHFGPRGVLAPAQTALVAAAWVAMSALPALPIAPIAFAASVVGAVAAAWLQGTADDRVTPINRRFEIEALVRAAPWLAAYLALVPLTDPAIPHNVLGTIEVLRHVESIAGFTVLGYVLAEGWGRLELRYRWTAWRVGVVAAAVAVVSDVLRRTAMPSLGSGPQIGAAVLAAAYGGWIYHLQRAHVRALVAERTRQSARQDAPRKRGRAKRRLA